MPIQTLNQSISFLLNYTTRNMRRYASDVLSQKGAGITVDQWGVLALLDEHGGELGNRRLCELMLKDRPTVTRIVDILCREVLVERTIDPEDRRRMRIRLTKAGRKTVTKAGRVVEEMRQNIVGSMSKTEQAELKKLLGRLNQTIEELRENVGMHP